MKQTKRKGFEWYRMLTKKQQKQFRRNTINNQPDESKWLNICLNDICNPMIFIFAFIPTGTPEGSQYWFHIIKKLEKR